MKNKFLKNNKNLKNEIKKITSTVLEVNKNVINNKSGPNSIDEWDSLKHLNIILACEEYFNIKFTNQELIELLDIDTIHEVIKEKLV
tara:strand:+ start:1036 stop:1296 length:261 start_codon:yes stop_codon:yes gene_type:complete